MTTVDGNLNAKQRRRLLREQQQQLIHDDNKDEKDPVKQEQRVINSIKPKPASTGSEQQKINERRPRAQRAKQKPGASTETESVEATTVTTLPRDDKEVNVQQRCLLKREATTKANGVNAPKVTKKQRIDSNGNGKSTGGHKSIHLTLFVGQLAFKTTEDMIRKHFAEAGKIQVRMLTDKITKKFKGMAFIEVKDSKALGAALSRHHTLLLGRRINVELTASGGGNKSESRRNKIDLLRKKQSTMQVEKTKALIQKHIDGPEYKLQQEDVDDRMIDFLSWFDFETAKQALDEYYRCVSDRVNNRKAFFMGILKRFRQTNGVE